MFGGYAARVMNERHDKRFFEREEPLFFALGIFLSGYPGFLFYILTVFLIGILLSLYYAVMNKGRAPLYYAWFPAALFAILITNWAVPESFLNFFKL